MSKHNGKAIFQVAFHEPIFISGIGTLPATLNAQTAGADKGLKMTLDEPFIIVEATGKNGPQTLLAPITGAKAILLAKEEVPAKK